MPVSEAQKRATAAYEKKNYDKILVRFPKGIKGRIERQSESVNAYIIQAVIERLEADEDDFLQKELDTNKEQTEPIRATRTEAKTAQISPGKEEREEIPEKLAKSKNEPNKEPIDIYALQAELDARREEERRKIAEKEAENEAAKQREADELVEKIKQMRQGQRERKEREIEEDRERFPKLDEEKLKAALLSDKELWDDLANPKYKDDFIMQYGKYNYAMIQKCIQEIENDEKEKIRQESIQRAKMEY